MEDFILKRSTISKKFLYDFFNIRGVKYSDTVISIQFDVVAKWLNVEKKNLKRVLVANFTKNIDYTEERILVKNKNRGANYVSKILITPDCFKDICMLSQTAKAKEVRQYYRTVEKLLMTYYEDIEEKVKNELEVIKKNLVPDNRPVRGELYILKAQNATEEDVYKAGNSENLKKRLKQYNTGNANKIDFLFTLPVKDLFGVEGCVKNLARHHQYRRKKEVFKIDFNFFRLMYLKCKEFMEGAKSVFKLKPDEIKKCIRSMKRQPNYNDNKIGYYLVVGTRTK